MNDGLKDKHRKAIIDLLAAHERVEMVVLFGSRAMETFTPASDVDLALYGDDLTLSDQADLAAAIEELPMPQRVDLLLFNTIKNEKLLAHIKKHGLEWYRRGWGMSADWREYRLGDLTDWYSGGTPSKNIDRYWNGSIPWISASSMYGSRYNNSDHKITEEGLKAGSRLVPEETLLLLVRGSSLHQRIPVGISLRPVAFNQDVKAIRIKEKVLQEEILDPWYLLYWFISKQYDLLQMVESTGIGAGKFDTKQLQDLKIIIPPVNERKAVVATAKSIDDKIELNRQINQTLEEMAQAIFKSWFVDFEPVKAKIAARANLPSPFGRGVGGEGKKLPSQLLNNARTLRKNQTDAEKLLWQLLRGRQIAQCKFRRQHPIGKYILDFYCHEKKFAIELDGGQHNDPAQKKLDGKRTEWLKEQGIEVLRFWNSEVLRETEGVVERIYEYLTAPHPQPLSQGERGDDPVERAAMCAISGKTDDELDQLEAQGCANAASAGSAGAAPPDQLAQLRATAALFPDELTDSELGLIPKGWEYSTIGKEVDVLGGGTPSTKNPDFWDNGTFHWTTPKDLSGNQDKILLNTERKITEAGLGKISSGLLPIDTVLLSSRAPVGYLALAKVPVAVNQGYIAMKCTKKLPSVYVLQWANSVMDDIKQRASGTTFAEISKKNFRIIPVLVPTEEALTLYRQKVNFLYDKITESISETATLAELRDTLLPKLLSGEISVGAAQATIEEAV